MLDDDAGQQDYSSSRGGQQLNYNGSGRSGQQQEYEPRSSGLAGFSVREELSHSFNVWRMDMDYRSPDSSSPIHSQ